MTPNVELYLEIQLDEEATDILSNLEKHHAALLDVTVLKPSEIDPFGTQEVNTMKAADVKKLLLSMEKQKREREKLIKNLKGDNTIVKVRKHRNKPNKVIFQHSLKTKGTSTDCPERPLINIGDSVNPLFCEIRRSLRNVETKITNMQDVNLMISETTTTERESGSVFMCKEEKDRYGGHLRSNLTYRACRASKSTHVCRNYNKLTGEKCYCENCGTVGLLSECGKVQTEPPTRDIPPAIRMKQNQDETFGVYDGLARRIKLLEERLAHQEQVSVPKDYFKRIINKVVPSLPPKRTNNTRNQFLDTFSNDYIVGIDPEQITPPHGKSLYFNPDVHFPRNGINCFHMTPLYYNSNVKSDKATITDENYSAGNFWKWGEDILRPGIDLKNKIITLLNDILSKFAVNEKSPAFTNQSCKRDLKDNDKRSYEYAEEIDARYRTYDSRLDVKEDKHISRTYLAEPCNATKKVDVAYVNPKLSTWNRESQIAVKADAEQYRSIKDNRIGKEEFVKMISKADASQRKLLWRNIWQQAEANAQTREDLITIKIPMENDNHRMYEIDLSLREVEKLLS